ncbi:MAG: tRNA 2-thiouridine(34) synthase MnmA [Lentisphaerae bacterium]|jgi:tRNA-uridine 2-sulfurtransferase|nr:tRNA 2-thiouridine(34) synthase MnmA [Lentisphaerota bacterium]MBT5607793.1 tRNA 2-thiouridine(34) synthase MnmA [Lentisphaerota bacterium]MBT7061773.1 tRNA 2-thiouridine(34) synthase MnmA [Lentisphaerota bacterium]MBT7843989.1 tRNA 2-thiouridine(34) synthase MnmA [Lentisphaerota bacterium]
MTDTLSSRSRATGERVVVAMSGGVDSSVAVSLLQQEGYEVIGITLQLQACESVATSRSCCGVDSISRAQAVAGRLGIRHYVLNAVDEFNDRVLEPSWREYANGRTPSPCLLCNERIKFGTLLSRTRELGGTRLATGHYARITTDEHGTGSLLRGVDPGKDQSYFLAGITQEQLRSVLFPLGGLHKRDVRELAQRLRLPNADAHESQDACLMAPGQSFAEMLRQRFGDAPKAGPIVDGKGTVLGHHNGIHHYTVGQRRGLGIQSPRPHWVKAISRTESAVVATDSQLDLDGNEFIATGMNWLRGPTFEEAGICRVQVRYRHTPETATVKRLSPDAVHVALAHPVRAITPGQAAVFYDGERVLGRGWIDVSE